MNRFLKTDSFFFRSLILRQKAWKVVLLEVNLNKYKGLIDCVLSFKAFLKKKENELEIATNENKHKKAFSHFMLLFLDKIKRD